MKIGTKPERFRADVDSTRVELGPSSTELRGVDTDIRAKVTLASRIARTISERGLTQGEAAKVLGVGQPKVSALMRGRVEGFSFDRMFRLLNALDLDVEVTTRRRGRESRRPAVRVTRRIPRARRT